MSQGCTTITYNGITLLNTLMRSFSQDSVMDDSGTDLLFHRYVIRVVGYVVNMTNYANGAPLVTAIGATGGGQNGQTPQMTFSPSAAYNLVQVRHKLGEQRKQFAMAFGCDADGSGGTIVLSASQASDLMRATPQDPIDPGKAINSPVGLPYTGPGDGSHANILDIDLNNGPKARVLAVTHVAADEVLKCELEFEICKLECVRGCLDAAQSSQQTALAPAVLSNRWTVNDSIDHNYVTTRTYTGRLRLASLSIDPNDFRSWVVPNVYPGFRRESMSFVVDATGLNLDYNIVDREVILAAPAPATNWRFVHTESIGWDTNLSCTGECNMSLQGDRTVPRQLFVSMIDATFQAVMFPKDANGNNLVNTYITRELSFTDEVSSDGCLVHGHCVVQRVPKAIDSNGDSIVLTTQNLWQGTLAIPLNGIVGFQNALNAIPIGNGQTYGDVYGNYDPNFSRDSTTPDDEVAPALFGPLSSATAFACYLQDPCCVNHNITNAYPGNGASITDRQETTGEIGPQPVQVTVVETLPPPPPDQNLPNTPSPNDDSLGVKHWNTYRKESRTEQVPGSRIQLPLAPPANQQSQPSPTPPNKSGPQIDPVNPPKPFPPAWPFPWMPRGTINHDPDRGDSPSPPPQSSYQQTPSCAIVSLVPPLYRRIVRIEASSVGMVPQMPLPADLLDSDNQGQSISEYLLDWKIAPKVTEFTSDGQPLYGIAAEFVFALDRPPSLQGLQVGIAEPWNSGGGNYAWTGPQLFAQDPVGDGSTQVNPA